MIYFDNAVISFPKSKEVSAAIINYMNNIGASPGRSGHRLSIEAGRILYQCRENIAELFQKYRHQGNDMKIHRRKYAC